MTESPRVSWRLGPTGGWSTSRRASPAERRARTAARGKAPSVDGVTAGVRSGHAEQAVAGGAPSGFSRIQIAWCAGCWPTSPRPPGSHLPFHTTAGRPVNGRAKGPVLPRPAAGDRQPATILIRSSFSTRMMALACVAAEPRAAMTTGADHTELNGHRRHRHGSAGRAGRFCARYIPVDRGGSVIATVARPRCAS